MTWAGWVGYLITGFFMWKAATAERSDNGGGLSFGNAFKTSFIVWLIASLLSILFMYVLINFIDTSLLDVILQTQKDAMNQMSGLLGEEATAAAMAEIESQGASFGVGTVALGWIMGLVFPGAIIALIIAAIVKRDGSASNA